MQINIVELRNLEGKKISRNYKTENWLTQTNWNLKFLRFRAKNWFWRKIKEKNENAIYSMFPAWNCLVSPISGRCKLKLRISIKFNRKIDDLHRVLEFQRKPKFQLIGESQIVKSELNICCKSITKMMSCCIQ